MKIVVVAARVLLGLSGMEISRLLRAAGYSQCCLDERLSAWQGTYQHGMQSGKSLDLERRGDAF